MAVLAYILACTTFFRNFSLSLSLPTQDRAICYREDFSNIDDHKPQHRVRHFLNPAPPKAGTSLVFSHLDLGITESYAPSVVPLPSSGLGKSAESGMNGGESQPASQPCIWAVRGYFGSKSGKECFVLLAPRDYQRWWSPALLSWTPSELQSWD